MSLFCAAARAPLKGKRCYLVLKVFSSNLLLDLCILALIIARFSSDFAGVQGEGADKLEGFSPQNLPSPLGFGPTETRRGRCSGGGLLVLVGVY